MNPSVAFSAQHKWDRNFFLAFVTLGWLAVFAGFAGEFSERLRGHADYPAPLILWIHIVCFVGWMALLTIQVLLIRLRHHNIHRTLGIITFALAPVMIISGMGAELYSQHFYSPQFPANLNFFIAPIIETLLFAVCVGAAFLFRKDSSAHKRLIFLATSIILVAAFNRWWGESIYQVLGDGFWGMLTRTYLGLDLLIAFAVTYDLITRRRIHHVYLIFVPVILAAELLTSYIYHHSAWPGLVRTLLGL